MVEKLEREFDVTLADKGIEFTGILHFVSGTVVGVGLVLCCCSGFSIGYRKFSSGGRVFGEFISGSVHD